MKTLVSMLALALVMAFSAPAFAAPKTQAACEKAGMHWDQTAKSARRECSLLRSKGGRRDWRSPLSFRTPDARLSLRTAS
jgi:hypothetical protein